MNPCEQKLSNDHAALAAEFHAYKEVMEERNQRYIDKFDAQEKAVMVAESGAEKWRANANEWRSSMLDRERAFFSKSMGYVVGALSALALILTIVDKLK